MNWKLLVLIIITTPLFGQNTISFLNSNEVATKLSSVELKGHRIVPFDIIRGMIFVRAEINQQWGSFILDTGAPSIVVNQSKKESSKQQASSCKESFSVESIEINSFKWAGIERQNIEGLSVDISHLEKTSKQKILGLIGFELIKNNEVLFDYSGKRILLYPARKNSLHKSSKPVLSIPFRLQDHLPIIEVQIGGKKLRFGLDSGAAVNLIDKKYADILPPSSFNITQVEELQGLDQTVQKVSAATIPQTEIKKISCSDMKYLFTDLSHLKSSSDLQIDGLLGFPFFEKMKFSINYAKRKIYVWQMP